MDCKCCQYMIKTGKSHHCRDCWDKHHQGKIDDDWLDEEEYYKL